MSGYLLQVTYPETPCPPPRPLKNRLERSTCGLPTSLFHDLSSGTTVGNCAESPPKSLEHSKAFEPITKHLDSETAILSKDKEAKTPPPKSNMVGLDEMLTPKTDDDEDGGRLGIRTKPTPGMTPEQRKAAWAFGMTYQTSICGTGTPFTLVTLVRSHSITGDSDRQLFSSPSDTRRSDNSPSRPRIRNRLSSKITGKFCTPLRQRIPLPSPYMTEAQMRVEARRQKKMKQRAEEDLGIFGLRLGLQSLSLQEPKKPRCPPSGSKKRKFTRS